MGYFEEPLIICSWEYPNHQGVGCNAISPSDTENFLLLLQELRSTPSTADLMLSAATSINPFTDASGMPSTDVAAFAKVLDFIEIMNYDIWGSWSSSVGPNAPLADACAPAADQQGSAMSAVAAWTSAGFPKKKILLGVSGYGHGFSVPSTAAFQNNSLAPYPPFNKTNQPEGDSWAGAAGPDVCGVQQPAGGERAYPNPTSTKLISSQMNINSGVSLKMGSSLLLAYQQRACTTDLTSVARR